MTLTADVLLVITAPKNIIRRMSKKLCFRGPFKKQHGKWLETLLQSQRGNFYHIY